MFFLKHLDYEISIHPSFFGSGINDRLRDQLYSDREGSCNGEYYIVCITNIYDVSAGKVRPNRGEANFRMKYRAIVWKPFKGEVIDCAVTNVKDQGVFCEAGPLIVFVSRTHLPSGMTYNPDSTPPSFSNNAGESIDKGSAVRVQLIGLRSDVGNMYAIGKMSSSWLGAI